MIDFLVTKLSNGLTLIVHRQPSTPMAVVNVLYKAGAKNENPDKTGYAHLLEHMMFCGSENAPNFDYTVQKAGGSNNAFTTNDYTNYYISLPSVNIETALWLEADRMKNALISSESTEVQKKVVIEEFREGYLNQPYGDTWHLINALAYKKHPYRWPTIGLSVEHIEKATPEDLQMFYQQYYHPGNAILSVSSALDTGEMIRLAEKWFGGIESFDDFKTDELPQEPKQTEPRFQEVERNVPADMLIKSYAMGSRISLNYYACDLLTDILAQGRASRFYRQLVVKHKLFTHIDAYVTATTDPGQIMIEGRLSDDVQLADANKALEEELQKLISAGLQDTEIEKSLNLKSTNLAFTYQNLFEKTYHLAFFEMLGNAELINNETDLYRSLNKQKLKQYAADVFQTDNASTLFYRKSD